MMPFGLQGAPDTFQRLMDQVEHGLEEYTATYLNDLVIFSKMFKCHLKHMKYC